jgi:hypothetical protein
VTIPPKAAYSITVVGNSIGSIKRIAPIQSTYTAMMTRNKQLNSAPKISARPHPKVRSDVAGRSLRRCATRAIRTPPTAEKV